MSGVEDGRTHTLHPDDIKDDQIRIGRNDDNHIVIATDSAISRYHAALQFEHGKWWLIDQSSKNGTFVECASPLARDKRVRERVELHPKQLFRVGKTWLKFQKSESASHG